MFTHDNSTQAVRQRGVNDPRYIQVQDLGNPQGHMQGHMQGQLLQPQEYPNHPNYSAMEPEYDSYDPDIVDEDEMYADPQPDTKSTLDKIKDFLKSTTGIVTIVVVLAIIAALVIYYFTKSKGYQFIYY